MPVIDITSLNSDRVDSGNLIDIVDANQAGIISQAFLGELGRNNFKSVNANIPPPSVTPINTRDPAVQQRSPYAGNFNGQVPPRWVVTSDLWVNQGVAISLHAGVGATNWVFALRAAEEANQRGRARYAQNRAGSDSTAAQSTQDWFDNPTVNLTFQSGNLLPIYDSSGQVTDIVPYGLDDYYSFMELVNQPPVLSNGQNNYFWCYYISRVFPALLLKGYISPAGITLNESAEPGAINSTEWSCNLTVWDMSPRIWDRNGMTNAYTNATYL